MEGIMYSSIIYVDNLEHVLWKGLYLQDLHSEAIEGARENAVLFLPLLQSPCVMLIRADL